MAKQGTEENPKAGTLTGSNIPEEEKPIDKYDWFKLTKSWVFGSEDRVKAQVESIQSGIKWFFGLSSSATILTVMLKDPKFEGDNITLIGVALVALIGAYAISTLAVTTVSRSLDSPNNDEKIRDAFNHYIWWSKFYIITASVLMVVGMTVFPFALVKSYTKSVNTLSKPMADFTASAVISQNKKDKYIKGVSLSGFSPDSTRLVFRLDSGSTLDKTNRLRSFEHPLKHAHFDLEIPFRDSILVKTGTNYYLVLIYKYGDDPLFNKSVNLKIP